MVGTLAVSFCDKGEGQPVCLDLWSYPDGTFNLVLDNFQPEGSNQIAFPCALHQLSGVLKDRTFMSENGAGTVEIVRCGDVVCAEFNPTGGHSPFRHCIPVAAYGAAIQALEAHAVGYLA